MNTDAFQAACAWDRTDLWIQVKKDLARNKHLYARKPPQSPPNSVDRPVVLFHGLSDARGHDSVGGHCVTKEDLIDYCTSIASAAGTAHYNGRFTQTI